MVSLPGASAFRMFCDAAPILRTFVAVSVGMQRPMGSRGAPAVFTLTACNPCPCA